jgi:hypothetical protein
VQVLISVPEGSFVERRARRTPDHVVELGMVDNDNKLTLSDPESGEVKQRKYTPLLLLFPLKRLI